MTSKSGAHISPVHPVINNHGDTAANSPWRYRCYILRTHRHTWLHLVFLMVQFCHLLYDTIEMHGVPVFEIRMEPKPNSFQLHYIGRDLLQKHNYKHMDTVLIRNLYLFIYLFSKFSLVNMPLVNLFIITLILAQQCAKLGSTDCSLQIRVIQCISGDCR